MISFFTKLLGGDGTAPLPAPKSEAEKIAEKKIHIETTLNDLYVKIKGLEEKEKKFDNKLEALKSKAKEQLAAGNKADAKKYVEEAFKVKKQAQGYTEQKKHSVNQKFYLEQEIMDMETIGIFDSVDGHFKEIAERKIKMEIALNELVVKLKNLQEKEKENLFDQKMEAIRNKAKQLIWYGQTADAKKYVDEALEMQKQADDYAERKRILVDKKFQLEQAIKIMQTLDVFNHDCDIQSEKEGYFLNGFAFDKSKDGQAKADKMFKELLNEVKQKQEERKEKKEKKAVNKIEAGISVNIVIGSSQANKDVSEQQKVEDAEVNL